MTPSERADILDKAADYIDVHGWYQGNYSDLDDCVKGADARTPKCCAVGAISKVMFNNAVAIDEDGPGADVLGCLNDFLEQCGFGPFSDDLIDRIGNWNDDQTRTKEEVTTAMRECAKQLRTKESA